MADDENNTEGPSSRDDPQEAEESSPRRGTPSYYYRQLYNSYRRFRNYASDDPWIVHYLIFACYLGVYAISPSFLKSTYFREMTYRTSILTILQTTINVHRGYDRFDQLRMLGLVLIALCLKDMFRAVGFEFCAHFAGLERCSRWFNWIGAVAPSPVDPNRPPFTWLLMATAVFTAIELAILGYLAYSRRIGLVRRIFALWAVVAVAETGMSAIRMGNKWTRQRVTVAVPICVPFIRMDYLVLLFLPSSLPVFISVPYLLLMDQFRCPSPPLPLPFFRLKVQSTCPIHLVPSKPEPLKTTSIKTGPQPAGFHLYDDKNFYDNFEKLGKRKRSQLPIT